MGIRNEDKVLDSAVYLEAGATQAESGQGKSDGVFGNACKSRRFY